VSLSRHVFSRTGNAPDLGALITPVRTAVGDPFYLSAELKAGDVVTVLVEKPTDWQPTEIAAVQSAVNAAPDQTPESDAQSQIDQLPIWAQALALTLLDEINRLRTQPTTTFGLITPKQAVDAMRAKAGTL
jgi:hypothetical protein